MSKLYVIPTPVGNLEDITFRALSVIKECNFILCEDTRTTIKLLSHFSVSKPLFAYHQHNEHYKTDGFIQRILSGEKAGLISDAGTPGISDPGYLIVRKCIDAGIEVECLPGATAFVPALILSGFPCERFCFEGFLPHKKGRHSRLLALKEESRTMVFYESPHRLLKTLEHFAEYFGHERPISVSRELTKIYEETIRCNIAEMIEHFKKNQPKGEFVIVVKGME